MLNIHIRSSHAHFKKFLCECKESRYIDAVPVSGCVCPGDILMYECTVTERGVTIWTGSAFNCSSSNNEIAFLHSRFNVGTYDTCNNGAIVAMGLAAEGNNYTSQLNVTVTPDTAGKTVMCVGDNGLYSTLFLSRVIPTIRGLWLCKAGQKLTYNIYNLLLVITHFYNLTNLGSAMLTYH